MNSSASSANSAIVAATPLKSLRLGRTVQHVVARIIRFWDSKNVNKNDQFKGITVLQLDEHDCVINAFIPANLATQFRSSLNDGSIVRLDRFEVTRCPHMYKITEHEFVVRFLPSTRIGNVNTGAPLIKLDKFMVRGYSHLQILTNTNLELPDIVGEIRSVQGSDFKNHEAATRVVVRILIEPTFTVSKIVKDSNLSDDEEENDVYLTGTGQGWPDHVERSGEECGGSVAPQTSSSKKKCMKRE